MNQTGTGFLCAGAVGFINAANNFGAAGTTILNAGNLSLGNSAALGANASNTVTINGGTLRFGENGLTLANSFVLNAGLTAIRSDAALGTGGAPIEFTHNSSGFLHPLGGFALKRDILLSGNTFFSSPMGIFTNGETLSINGVIATQTITGMASGIRKEGAGRLGVLSIAEGETGVAAFTGALTVNSGGAVKAGNSVGLLTVGGLTLNAGSVTEVEANGYAVPGSDYTQIISSGAVTISTSALLSVDPGPLAEIGTAIVIIRNDSGAAISGNYLGLSEGAQFVSGPNLWQITFAFNSPGGDGQANDLALIAAIPEPATFALTLGVAAAGASFWWRRRRPAERSAADALAEQEERDGAESA